MDFLLRRRVGSSSSVSLAGAGAGIPWSGQLAGQLSLRSFSQANCDSKVEDAVHGCCVLFCS